MATTLKTHPEAVAAAPKLVLVLDENAERQRLARAALGGAGYFADGAGGAAGARAKLDTLHPDLIVADLRLADADGHPLARGLLLNSDLESVPIVAIAANPEEISRRRELSDLFDGYVCEPLEAPALLGRVEEILAETGEPARGEGDADPPADRPLGRAEEILAAIEEGLPASQGAAGSRAWLEQLAGSAALGQDASLAGYLRRAQKLTENRTVRGAIGFRTLIRLCRERLESGPDPTPDFGRLRSDYIANRIRELPGLRDALRRSDLQALRTGGHNVKGTGAAYGFAELTELGRALESAAKASGLLEIEVLLGRMEVYLTLTRPAAWP